jgi:uncharacterized protein YfaS (alpha-2-macroglobulin family)
VELTLADAPAFQLSGDRQQSIELAPGEVKSVGYHLRASQVGRQELQITARGNGVADSVRREIEVVPDGQRVEHVANGSLEQPAAVDLEIPPNAIPGSVRTIVKIHPSTFSQLVEGLDGIFQMPYGCFEQTSSTTYPNVLALDYLKRTGQSVPAVEARARQYIHLGYQRLLGFEVSGGGFDWFGHPPAKSVLTAYGLMEFEDMARVHDIDPTLIDRTRKWLLAQQHADGSWTPDRLLHDDPTRVARGPGQTDLSRLCTTAYIAWSVFANERDQQKSRTTLNFLLAHRPDAIEEAYVLAVVCNAHRRRCWR